MQKFRNSGIEGGNGGLVRQIWLHKIQKYDLLCSKYTGDRLLAPSAPQQRERYAKVNPDITSVDASKLPFGISISLANPRQAIAHKSPWNA